MQEKFRNRQTRLYYKAFNDLQVENATTGLAQKITERKVKEVKLQDDLTLAKNIETRNFTYV